MLQKNCIYILYACAFIPFVVFQSLNCVQLFANPWTAACQASLSFTVSWSLLKILSIELVMPPRHLVLSSPSSPAFNLSQHQSLFQSVGYLHQVHQSFGASASASVLPMNIQDWFPLGVTGFISLQSKALKNLLQHHSSKASILQLSALFMIQLSHPYMTTRKAIALTIWTFVSKLMPLCFNMLSWLVITFLPRSKCLLIPWLQWFWSPRK